MNDQNTKTAEIPADIIEANSATLRTAGFVTPGGNLLGRVGRHNEIPAAMGYGSGKPQSSSADVAAYAKWQRDTGVVRLCRFSSQVAISAATVPTRPQLEAMEDASAGMPTAMEVCDQKGNTVRWQMIDSPTRRDLSEFFRAV